MRRVSVVIPAYCEADRIGATIRAADAALEAAGFEREILVVDDGSPDATAAEARAAGARVLRLERNAGKGRAVERGLAEASGDWFLLLDADLGESAVEAPKLLTPLLEGAAEMTVAAFGRNATGRPARAGFGLTLALARWGMRRAGCPPLASPISGQRGLTRAAWERIGRLEPGFGLELGLNLDAARLGLRVVEVPTAMTHRWTGRNWAGFRHRARQFVAVAGALARRWPLRAVRAPGKRDPGGGR